MYIGNIVIETISTKNKFYKLFNVVNDINNIIENIPTLIIGWEYTKKICYNDNLSILEKKIDDKCFWTFSRFEKRYDYEIDLKTFLKTCLENTTKNIKYEYINVLTCKRTNIKKIINFLTFNKNTYIYIKNNTFIYILDSEIIYGVDFNLIDYLNIERKKIYRILYSAENKLFFNNDLLDENTKQIIKDKEYLTPYLIKILQTNGE